MLALVTYFPDALTNKQIHSLIKLYGRKKMKVEIGKIHHKLFQNPEHVIFQQRIQQLFKDN